VILRRGGRPRSVAKKPITRPGPKKGGFSRGGGGGVVLEEKKDATKKVVGGCGVYQEEKHAQTEKVLPRDGEKSRAREGAHIGGKKEKEGGGDEIWRTEVPGCSEGKTPQIRREVLAAGTRSRAKAGRPSLYRGQRKRELHAVEKSKEDNVLD